MITPKEFENRWIRSPLIRLKEENVAHLPIPAASKDFLVQAGLPERPMFDIRCHALWERFLPVAEVLPSAEFACDTKNLYLLATTGYQDCICLCMDIEHDGEIVYIIADSDKPKRFANSSVIYLAEFFLTMQMLLQEMSLYESYEESKKGLDSYIEALVTGDLEAIGRHVADNERYYDYADVLEATLLRIEPQAFEHRENFWPAQLLSMRT